MIKRWFPFIILMVSIIINYLYPKLQGTSVGNINKDRKLDISPNSYAFSIWGIIYFTLILLTLFKPNWSNNSINFFIISCILNSLWIIIWTTKSQQNINIYLGNIILIFIVISLLFFWNENITTNLKNKKNIFINIFFQNIIALYLSWCVGASLLNTGISLKSIINDKIINYFVTISLCLFHILWQVYGRFYSTNSSFMKDSLTVPIVGLWTSLAIYNNNKTPNFGLFASIITASCLIYNMYHIK